MPQSGGSSTPGGSSAGLFLPPNQAGAASNFQGLVDPLIQQGLGGLSAMGGVSPAQTAYPQVLTTASQTLNNPYAANQIAGAGDANTLYQNYLRPMGISQGQDLSSLGSLAQGQSANPLYAANNPAYQWAGNLGGQIQPQFSNAIAPTLAAGLSPAFGQGQAYGSSAATTLANLVPGIMEASSQPAFGNAVAAGASTAPQLFQAGNQTLQAAFDPQNALYNRTLQQVQDQSGAQLANQGLLGTPYGAGVQGQTGANFNIDWQNNLLNRMATGGQAAGNLFGEGINQLTGPAAAQLAALGQGGQLASGLYGAGVGDITSPALAGATGAATGANAGATLGQSALSSLLSPANAGVTAQLQGASGLGSLINSAQGGYGGAQNMIGNLAQQAPQLMGAPYNAYQQQQGNNFGALQNLIGLGNANYQVPQQAISDLTGYMGLGQQASQIASQIGQNNFNQGAQSAQGLGQLAGLGSNALFGSSPFGSSGLLGGGAGGLLGSQGALFGTAADASIAAGGPPLAAAAPLAFSA